MTMNVARLATVYKNDYESEGKGVLEAFGFSGNVAAELASIDDANAKYLLDNLFGHVHGTKKGAPTPASAPSPETKTSHTLSM